MTTDRLPRGFNAWGIATVGADFASGVLAFALTWVASGHGPGVASAVLTVTVAPTVVFGLLGGAMADRFGPRQVMVVCTLLLLTISAALAIAVTYWAASPTLLMAAAAAIGTVSAFHRPAVGVFPRLFASDAALGTAMARIGVAGQVAGTIAPPLGGLLIGAIALHGVAWMDAAGCLAMVAVLLLVRPPLTPAASPDAASVRGIIGGIAAARTTDGIPVLLACVALVAGAVIPSVVLGVPLAARERGWSASEAGLIEAGWIAGGLVVGAWFSWRGTAVRVWRPMAAGPLVTAAGLVGLAVSSSWVLGAVSTCVVGAGVVVFTAHVFPTYVRLAPTSMVSRFQSLLIMVQRTPQLVINPLLGAAIGFTGTAPVLLCAGGIAIAAAVLVTTDRTLRTFRS